jgi:hypothetical protein
MFKQIILICPSLILAANSANSQQSPPNSEKAKQIEALVSALQLAHNGFFNTPRPPGTTNEILTKNA